LAEWRFFSLDWKRSSFTDLNRMRKRITSQCAEIDGKADLFHRVPLYFAQRIKFCIENDGNHFENIIYQHQN